MEEQQEQVKWVPLGDCQAVWRRHGWIPPSEQEQYQRKWACFKANAGVMQRHQTNEDNWK